MRIDTKNLTIADIVKNKKTLIASKKQTPIYGVATISGAKKGATPRIITKAEGESEDPNTLKVTIIGNTALWCDSHMDVLAVGCFDKTVEDQGNRIPHLTSHIHDLEHKIGKTLKVYTEMIDVAEFGVKSDVKRTQVLLMDSEVIKQWNPKIFQLYKDEEIDQHSIGMQYVRLELAVNDEEYKEEFEAWNKYYERVINKEKIDARGYFWFVTEIKLYEISAVLFGSNELTPTVSTGKSTAAPSKKDTQQNEEDRAPSDDTLGKRKRMQL